jgi:hypothetical protein
VIDGGPYGNSQLARFNVWPTLEAFYRADERRRESRQLDFAGLPKRWKDRSGWRWIVFFMATTCEVVAQRVDHGRSPATDNDRGPVVLLGAVPSFQGSSAYPPRLRTTLESYRDRPAWTQSTIKDLADVILGDALALTRDPDFMDTIARRIAIAATLLGALFRNPESGVYDIPLMEINRRIAAGEVYVADI